MYVFMYTYVYHTHTHTHTYCGHKVLMAIWSVSANDAFKGELVRAKILELSIDMVALAHRSQKNLKKK